MALKANQNNLHDQAIPLTRGTTMLCSPEANKKVSVLFFLAEAFKAQSMLKASNGGFYGPQA